MKEPAAAASGQKKQLIILAGLAVVLVAVVAMQFGQDAAPAAQAMSQGKATPAALGAQANGSRGAAIKPQALSANLALSQPGTSDESLNQGAFSSFWSLSEPVAAGVEEAPPPKIRLSATLIGHDGMLDVAVIDGTLRYVGDTLQGWSLDSITSRAVALRSPSDRVVTVAMPLFQCTPPPVLPAAAPRTTSVAAAPAEPASDS